MNKLRREILNSTVYKKGMPIDAVITWVDGADPAHQQKLDAYLRDIGGERPAAASSTRFDQSGELEYCVVSILKFAPWIRTIFIVTDQQIPPLQEKLSVTSFAGKIKIIDHREIFKGYEQYLPTFNIRSILSMLWRIEAMAEHFIFFNDDFALLKPVEPDDFFQNDKVVIRGKWTTFSDKKWISRLSKLLKQIIGYTSQNTASFRIRHLAAQELSAKLAGLHKQYYQLEHNPHPWRRSTTEKFFNEHPVEFEKNISYKLRSSEQFISECLAAHLEIVNKTAIFNNKLHTLQLKPAEQSYARLIKKMKAADNDNNIAFVCVQSIEKAPHQHRQKVIDWLNKRVGTLDKFIANTGVK